MMNKMRETKEHMEAEKGKEEGGNEISK